MSQVSVIIPTYNRGWILRDAIDSVMAQDYKDYELIVVDDGSTDNTPEILKNYPDIIVLKQKNRGVSAARNAGVQISKADNIAFLDSDDLWLPGKLQSQFNFFNTNPSAQICQTEEIWIRNGVRVNAKKRHRKQQGMIFDRCLDLCIISPSAVMMKKSLFIKVGGFDETLPACEDYDLWLRIASWCPVYLIEEALIIKRGGHSDQLSKIPGLDRFRIRALKKLLDSGSLKSKQHEAAIKTLQEKCEIYATGCLKRGRVEEAKEYLRIPEIYSS